MNVQNMLKYTADLSHGVTLTPLRMAFVRGEALAHMFIITAYENNQKVDLTGATVNGYMMRGDQTTLTFDGSVVNGDAVISLPGAAYSVTGRFRLAIQATMNGVTTTLFYGEGAVSPSTTDVIAIPEEILMPSLENIEAQVEEMVAATEAAKSVIKGAVVRNLLDNSDFRNPINQRGKTSYNATGYTIDRWYTNMGGNATVTVGNGKIRLSKANTGGAFYQRLPVDLTGRTMTYAVKTANGITCKSAVISSTNDYVQIDGLKAYLAVYVDSAGTTIFQIYFNDTSSIEMDLEWMALYEGSYTAETLPAYQPKGYAAELAECQRYYLPLMGEPLGFGYINGAGTSAFINVPIPQQMRIMPSLPENRTFYVRGGDSKQFVTTAYNLDKMSANSVRIIFQTEGIASNTTCSAFGYELYLSADL